MADRMTAAQRSWTMKQVKLQNGSLELLMQRRLKGCGLRFSLHCKDLAGTPDIVFRRKRVAVFIDGDFWHGWRLPAWQHRLPEYWKRKLNGNRTRDRRNFRRLRASGWTVLRIWEHELLSDCDRCLRRVRDALDRKSQ